MTWTDQCVELPKECAGIVLIDSAGERRTVMCEAWIYDPEDEAQFETRGGLRLHTLSRLELPPHVLRDAKRELGVRIMNGVEAGSIVPSRPLRRAAAAYWPQSASIK
jgi:hypothetical protein